MSSKSQKVKSFHTKNLDENDEIDRLERNYLGWLTISGIFIVAASVIKDYGIYYSLIFILIVIVILIVTLSDYLSQKKRLNNLGIDVPNRLDWLGAINLISIVVLIILSIHLFTSKDQK